MSVHIKLRLENLIEPDVISRYIKEVHGLCKKYISCLWKKVFAYSRLWSIRLLKTASVILITLMEFRFGSLMLILYNDLCFIQDFLDDGHNLPACSFIVHATCVSQLVDSFQWSEGLCLPACASYSFHQENIQVRIKYTCQSKFFSLVCKSQPKLLNFNAKQTWTSR